jgi:hypothetical protein
MLAPILDDLPPSERETLFALVDTVFFASLMVEEGEPVRVAVVHDAQGSAGLANVLDSNFHGEWGDDPPPAWDITQIDRRPFDAPTLAKLSRGLKYGSQLAVVGGMVPDLWIDGIARRHPRTDGGDVARIAAPRPGVLVFEVENGEWLRFEAGQRVQSSINVFADDCPIRAAVGRITGAPGKWEGLSSMEWALHRLLHKMRATGHGAILAMLPKPPDAAVLANVGYRRVDPDAFASRIRADWDKRWKVISAQVVRHDSDMTAAQVRHEAQLRLNLDERVRSPVVSG